MSGLRKVDVVVDSAGKFFGIFGRGSKKSLGGSMPGSLRVINCGFIDQVELLQGPKVLYQPAAPGEFCVVTLSPVAFEQGDVDWDVYVGQNVTADPGDYLVKFPGSDPIDGVSDQIHGVPEAAGVEINMLCGLLETDDPVEAKLLLTAAANNVFVDRPITAWTATHAYADGALVQLSDDLVYQAQGAGTSGGSTPTPPGWDATVVDGTVTWLGVSQEAPPTAGKVRCLVLVATPDTP